MGLLLAHCSGSQRVSDSVSVVTLYADGVSEIVVCTSHEVVFCVKTLVFRTSVELTVFTWFTFVESLLTLSSMLCVLALSSCRMDRMGSWLRVCGCVIVDLHPVASCAGFTSLSSSNSERDG